MHNKYVQILLRNIIVFRVWFPAHPWNNYLWLLHNTRVTPFCKGELIKEYVYDVYLVQVCVCVCVMCSGYRIKVCEWNALV